MMARLEIDEDERTATATQHATELASDNQSNATMESQMQTLLSQVHALQIANTHGNQTNCGNNFGRGRGRGHRRSANRGTVRGRGRSSTPPNPKYLWTHVNCAHGIKECTYPSDGHKKDATFAYMMGVKTNRCYNITK